MQLSMVVLTLNEARNIRACLRSLARQTDTRFEVIVVDAASSDGTQDIVRGMMEDFPVRLRLEALGHQASIGEARNRGVALSAAPAIGFLSADAELDPKWVEEALASLPGADMVCGLQVHAPHRPTAAAAVRGLRYHFPETRVSDPMPYASNVAAVYRRRVLESHPFDPWSNAAEDLLIALQVREDGGRVVYNPNMRVHHHDVDTARQEMRKCVREGHGCAVYRRRIGTQREVLGWGGALAAAGVASVAMPLVGIPALVGILYAPAARRAVRRRRHMPAGLVAKGVAASPLFDLAYLANYIRGLAARPPADALPRSTPKAQETQA